ncbi:GPI-anchor transamidase, putative [Plasmodium knowlesi strain H]|uniref:GPI-anchor transamidase, putative n=3 Tax=Plasmodium knowlesi TaxID=5850 RepID=A0A5K1UAT2_PLAKH|nr:GPI-anchor transamidase, putative [Plasmodium knowlesi strain H]OTN65234.1 putative GPI-anchor transamidase [Plasmodium knowlesi]CAA9988315.1 GPI-anchor transamidase, putative [Plasmodium knowlesi strain H]SBO20223.1 GPI-anchor transamidase, putative [Plasmodium knowlesi strain H]SBO20262.1 GPI-anchor transamidase, putative [Plasmodium knowlesi strain H]VVS77789.1 GPI-anchor transamidase, putative [Plasmodium knowlesi strain H]|eukprot:XP_002259294.1 gpi8p transamidase, putative [Plasmodium knowlesi strain H]
MELWKVFVYCVLVAIKHAVAPSVYFSGLDIKNMKGKYKEIEEGHAKQNVNDIFLHELKKSNYQLNNNIIALSTSRHYFNYRHTSNLLTAYKYLKNAGDNMDRNILLMVPFDQACNCRNMVGGTIFNEYEKPSSEDLKEKKMKENLYSHLNIDYKNDNIRDEQIRRVIRHRYDALTPVKYRLYTNGNREKNLFIYMTGHGGVSFFKIQDFNIVSSAEFSLYIQELLIKNIYKYIFVIIDTCQGYSFYDQILNFLEKNKINNVFLMSSSDKNENSYSLHSSRYLSVSTVDRFTFYFFSYLENINRIYADEPYKNTKAFSLYNILNYLKTQHLISTPTINNFKFSVSMFMHSKNILFYDSSGFYLSKDTQEGALDGLGKSSYNAKHKTDKTATRNTCLGDLSACGHMKNEIHTHMGNLYSRSSFYNNVEVYFKEESHFTDYYFTAECFSGGYLLPSFLFLVIIALCLLFFLFT